MNKQPAIPSLSDQKLLLEIKQLQLSTDSLGQFASRLWPIFATFLTGTLSLIAVAVSLWTQSKQVSIEGHQNHLEALDRALQLATDNSTQVDRRIAGIWQLRDSWDNPDDFEVAASVLSAELGLVDDRYRYARSAAAEVIGTAWPRTDPCDRNHLASPLFGTS